MEHVHPIGDAAGKGRMLRMQAGLGGLTVFLLAFVGSLAVLQSAACARDAARVSVSVAAQSADTKARVESVIRQKFRSRPDVVVTDEQPSLCIRLTVTETAHSPYVFAFVVLKPYTKEYLSTLLAVEADAPIDPTKPIAVKPAFRTLPRLYAGESGPTVVVKASLEEAAETCAAMIDARDIEELRRARQSVQDRLGSGATP